MTPFFFFTEMFGLQGPEAYAYTSRSNCLDVPGIDDRKDFQDTLVRVFSPHNRFENGLFNTLNRKPCRSLDSAHMSKPKYFECSP